MAAPAAQAKPLNIKHISTDVIVTDDHLGCLLRRIGLEPKLKEFPTCQENPFLLKMAVLSHRGYHDQNFVICFAFDSRQKGKLLKLEPSDVRNIVSYICSVLTMTTQKTIVQLVGRTGSRNTCKLITCFETLQCQKIIVNDFSASVTSIDEFLRMSIDDLERVTSKLEQLTNPRRIEMASLPQSDKRIRLEDAANANDRNVIIFANQLLQVPGITEKVALAIAKRFSTPKDLLAYIDTGHTLQETEIDHPSGDKKKYV